MKIIKLHNKEFELFISKSEIDELVCSIAKK